MEADVDRRSDDPRPHHKAGQSLSTHADNAGRPLFCCWNQQTGRSITGRGYGCGTNAYTITSQQPHSPASWRGSRGLCWHKVAATKRASSQRSPDPAFRPARGWPSRSLAQAGMYSYLPRSASGIEEMEKRSRRRIRDLVTQAASQGLSENEIGCARISIMARSSTAPCKGRIQMRKTNPLHLLKFGLQRTAGPYKWVKTCRGGPEIRLLLYPRNRT